MGNGHTTEAANERRPGTAESDESDAPEVAPLEPKPTKPIPASAIRSKMAELSDDDLGGEPSSENPQSHQGQDLLLGTRKGAKGRTKPLCSEAIHGTGGDNETGSVVA
eukprot:NODE_7128_length_504_cov_9.808791_g6692_i0.p3 GENE.NODE_7128_length_504_cov_9.808791_g6692_i0~~NODE_7128_length_504_cov_9.808791_g6692_i0.p3  ORF type:complete len:108 (-),score=11.80 NODE_7128_length_504_cov_9.808791_g6692_i0:92-415(-)